MNKVFTDGCTHIIGGSLEDAIHKLDAFYGQAVGTTKADPECWEECAADETISIWLDDKSQPGDIGSGTLARKTAAEWAATMPSGFLCSTEQ